jgi:hypothetical protein
MLSSSLASFTRGATTGREKAAAERRTAVCYIERARSQQRNFQGT